MTNALTRSGLGLALGLLWLAPTVGQEAGAPPALGWQSLFRAPPPVAVSTTPHPAVARISVQEADGVAFGSGTLVDIEGDQGLVITNWHVVEAAKGTIEVTFPDGFRSQAKVLKTDQDWDLAALVIWRPKAMPMKLAEAAPQVGQTLSIAGYGSGQFRSVTSRCTNYVAPSMQHPREMVELAATARQGDSGGPIINERGELAGVLFGTAGGETTGSYVGRVRWFLASVSPRLAAPSDGAAPPAHHIASSEAAPSDNPFLSPAAAVAKIADAGPEPQGSVPMTPVPEAAFRPASTPSAQRVATSVGGLPSDEPAVAWERPPSDRPTSAPQQASVWAARPLETVVESSAVGTDPSASAPASAADPWQVLLGPTLFDQAKSVLAVIGIAAVAMRWLKSAG